MHTLFSLLRLFHTASHYNIIDLSVFSLLPPFCSPLPHSMNVASHFTSLPLSSFLPSVLVNSSLTSLPRLVTLTFSLSPHAFTLNSLPAPHFFLSFRLLAPSFIFLISSLQFVYLYSFLMSLTSLFSVFSLLDMFSFHFPHLFSRLSLPPLTFPFPRTLTPSFLTSQLPFLLSHTLSALLSPIAFHQHRQ